MNRLIAVFLLLVALIARAEEKTDWDYPLGPIGGRCHLQLGGNSVRVSEITPGAPGAIAGLRANDYIFGAFDQPFNTAVRSTWNQYTGPLKGLGEAIEKAERSNGVLPLMVLRSGVGPLTVSVQLDANGGLGPAFPLGSAAFEETYEKACAAIHDGIVNETWRSKTGSGYPYRWAGLALLTHPDWHSTTGERPYRLSIDQVRDQCLSALENAQYAPVEQYLLDGTANPNFVDQFAGHENWVLNTSFLFLAEYLQKTKDSQYYDEFQTAAEKIANRIQWWTQPGGLYTRAGGAHAGVHSDYNGCGFNICVVHSFAALALARNVTDASGQPVLDLSVRPRDGRHFGYAEGETKPAAALPALPDGWDINLDPSLAEKISWQWQHLRESMNADYGAVFYWYAPTGHPFPRDGSARTAGASFAYHTYLNGQPAPAEDQAALDLMDDYLVRFNREHQYAHTHTISGVVFNHLAMPYWTSQQRRHFLENWKFYWNLARQPDGPPAYITTLFENDDDSHYLLGEIFTALPYGIARGGLALVPGWETSDLIVDFHQTPHSWEEPEFRTLTCTTGELDLQLALTNGLAQTIPDNEFTSTWSVTEGNPDAVQVASPNQLSTTVQFAEDGQYLLQLNVVSGSRSVTEQLRVHVHTQTHSGYEAGAVTWQGFGSIVGDSLDSLRWNSNFRNDTPSLARTAHCLDFPAFSESMGARVQGAIIPRSSGNHRFYIAADAKAELYLDTDGDGELELIASSTVNPQRHQWNASPDQASTLIPLIAGQPYAFEILHKVGNYDPGHLAVAWTTPTNPEIAIIESSCLAQLEPESGVTIVTEPADYSRSIGSSIRFTFGLSSADPAIYQWYRNGVPVGNPGTTDNLLLWPAGGGSEGDYHCIATTPSGVVTSRTAHLNVTNDGAIVSDSLWMDLFTETEGTEISDLTDDPGFPWLIDGYQQLTSFAYQTAVGSNNQLGHRVTGWLVPAETANYRLIATGDDRVQVFFSPTAYATHKKQAISTTSGSGHRVWTDVGAGKSDYFPLQAGQRYYIELLHKEYKGDSHFALALQKEGDPMPANGSGEIDASLFESRYGGYFEDEGPIPPYYADELYIAAYLDDATYDDPVKGGRFGDASGNGLANVFYYLFNLGDPAQASPAAGLPVLASEPSGGFTYSYVFPKNTPDFTAYPAVSADLTNWFLISDPAAPAQPTGSSVESLDADYNLHHLQFPASETPLFFRFEATDAP